MGNSFKIWQIYVGAFATAVIFVACGEVGDTSQSTYSSSSQTMSSDSQGSDDSSSNENAVCQGTCCNGSPYDNTKNFCTDDQLYPLCEGKTYDPYERGCFRNELYFRCDIESTRGICVHNSALRCRQEGKGENYIRDPLPGMKCEENGAITGKIIDISDNDREYKIAQIGKQVWLAENLKYDEPRSKCYNNDPDNCDKYGKLYDWATAMDLPSECNNTNQNCPPSTGAGLWPGLCPTGFALPSSEDWKALADYAGGDSIAGNRLKSKTGWSNNSNGTDNYGFNALPGGYYNRIMGEWGVDDTRIGDRSMWWSSDQKIVEADYWTIISADTEIRTHFQAKALYMTYVRCLHY